MTTSSDGSIVVGYSSEYNYGDSESYFYFFDFQEANSLKTAFEAAGYKTPQLLEEIQYKFKN